ncbi:tyrosine--tRNA ligase [Oceanisphaera arctica]|uniref:Tyrosine--tRNA ligase n=1 Tax=Oceanisphaera arctica TaxID=641510 RepID=A0A2P5TQ42_9GAMM|nr:tyrosine--tRNA ligase [Oceanisphaera arctica]PPL17810.1 tyrosine--tRNA ligase [Oceanisphaera arctica]GHA23141.1 tyrosine--tRNA ligase 1 [Oceanisphaera arctica]
MPDLHESPLQEPHAHNPLLQELKQRGLIAQQSDAGTLAAHLNGQRRVVYCGFDPTAGSLHIGHLVPLLMLRRFRDAGHKVVALIGGATGMIGDPSFKASERSLNDADTVQKWVSDLKQQISRLLDADHDRERVRLLDNADWMSQLDLFAFLRDIGKHFSVNAMIAKESVKQRLARPDQGLSFTEFAYSLLQSYDFAVLNREQDCTLQIGGNDQWGNITSGIDLTRRLNQQQVFGLTLPLITKANGTKFGKTETGTVWLDPARTSPYAFYQFWLNTSDADVYRFLRYYSLRSVEEIDAIEHIDQATGGRPEAQRWLARELTMLVHGEEALAAAEHISQALFSGDFSHLSLVEFEQLEQDGIPQTRIEGTEQLSTLSQLAAPSRLPALSRLLVDCALAGSQRQARELIANGAIAVNGDAVTTDTPELSLLHQRYLVLRRGKKHFHLIRFGD